MQVAELLKLAEWFESNIVGAGVITGYVNLHNKMSQNIRSNGYHHTMVSFDAEKEKLFDSIGSITFQNLTLEQINFLDKLQVVSLLGTQGIEVVRGILIDNSLDIAAAYEKIEKLSSIINDANTKMTKIKSALSMFFKSREDNEVGSGNVLVRVYFKDDVAIDNLTRFKELGVLWFDIGRGIAMAQGKTQDDFKIISAEKGSVILSFSVAIGIACLASKIILGGMKVVEKILDIRKKIEEIKNLKLKNKQIEQDLEKEAENAKKEAVDNILNSVVGELKLNVKEQGDVVNALKIAIKNLINFTEKGGVVDFVQATEEDDGDEDARVKINKLNQNISEIRLLENKVKILVYKKEENT